MTHLLTRKRVTELNSLSESNGGLLAPEKVIAFARNKSTALHSAFEWNNTKAGHLYRLEQARHIIRAVIVIIEHKNVPTSVQAFVSLPRDRKPEGGYRTTIAVMSKAEHKAELLQCALSDVRSFLLKYNNLCELAGVVREMKKLVRKTGG